MGAFWLHALGPLVLLEGRVITKLFRVMKHFYSNGRGLFHDDNAVDENDVTHTLQHSLSRDLNPAELLWEILDHVLDGSLLYCHQNTK